MTTANIDVRVNSSELNGLINQLQTADQSLEEVRRSANQAARSMDNLGDEAAQAGRQVEAAGNAGADGMGALGLAAGAGAAAMAGVAAAAALASAAIAKYAEETANQETKLNTLLNQTDEFISSLGATIMQSDGAKRVMSLLSGVMTTLSNNMDTVGSVITTVVNVGLEILNRAIQIGIVGFTAYRLAVIAAEANLQVVMTAFLTLSDYVARATLAVAGLGLAFAEGLVKAMQLGIDKFGQLIEAIAPFASRMGIDLSGVTTSLGNMNEGLDTVVAGLQNVQDAATQTGLDIAARQAERLNRLQTNLADSAAEAWAEIETMGDRLIAVDATFQTANDTLEESIRLQGEYTDAVDRAAEAQVGLAAAMDAVGRARATAEQEAARESERIQQEAAQREELLARYRADRLAEIQQRSYDDNQVALEDSLAELLDPAQQRLELLFGGGDLEELMDRTDKFSNKLVTRLLNMSDEGAAALGVLNTAMNDMAVGFVSSMGSALMSGERVDKALKKALAGMLSSLGQTYLAQGAALLIPPPFNPLGNPVAGGVMLGVGAGMLGLSAAFGGIGAGASKKSPSTASASTTPGQSQTTYTNVSFGFVGDRRAAGREVADVQEDARRRGL